MQSQRCRYRPLRPCAAGAKVHPLHPGYPIRIDLRVNAETKALLSRAYELAGYSNLTSFVIATASERAQRVIEEHNRFTLSDRDRDIFLAALENPPEPNKALRDAARKYGAR